MKAADAANAMIECIGSKRTQVNVVDQQWTNWYHGGDLSCDWHCLEHKN